MDVDALIDTYVDDVVQLLPRKQRNDVALELRELLREELQSRAASQGQTLNSDIALEGLRAFGRPEDVAARYFEPLTIIPPTQTRRFAFAAIIGALVLIALSPLSPIGDASTRSQQLQLSILAWLGVLVVYFGIQSYRHRRRNAANLWVPRGRDSVNRFGSVALIALIAVGIVAYGAPGWVFAQFTHGGTLSALLDYDSAFYSSRLPVLFFVWGCQAVLFAVLAVRGRWSPLLRRVDIGLEIGIVLVLVWFFAAGDVFKEAALNKPALSLISAAILIMSIDVGVKLYRGVNRIPLPNALRSQTN